MRTFVALALAALANMAPLAVAASAQVLEPHTRTLSFGTVVGDAAVERPLRVTNRGRTAVRIRNVQLTPPLSIAKMEPSLEPGESADIVVRLGSPRQPGRFEGQLVVSFEGGGEALAVDIDAIVAPPIEIVPPAELVAVTERGTPMRASVEIESHLDHPIHLTGGSASNERFTTALEALEPGRRYRLALDMPGEGPAGKRVDTITLATDDPAYPEVTVHARTLLRERVYAYPDAVDLGRVSASSPPPGTSVMVYQKGGRDFQVTASTDLPFLVLRPEKAAVSGDRWQVFLSIDASRLTPGKTSGTLTIGTNDPEFVLLRVPVTALVD
jgi:hypothetical protein